MFGCAIALAPFPIVIALLPTLAGSRRNDTRGPPYHQIEPLHPEAHGSSGWRRQSGEERRRRISCLSQPGPRQDFGAATAATTYRCCLRSPRWLDIAEIARRPPLRALIASLRQVRGRVGAGSYRCRQFFPRTAPSSVRFAILVASSIAMELAAGEARPGLRSLPDGDVGTDTVGPVFRTVIECSLE